MAICAHARKKKNYFSALFSRLLLVIVDAREHKLGIAEKDGRRDSGAAGFYERVTCTSQPKIFKIWSHGTLNQFNCAGYEA